MRAVVLVGGFGTRLRPLTLTTPKQMLPIVDRPMIEWVVGHLADHGVEQAVLSMGYRPDVFTAAYPDQTCAGVPLVYAVEDVPLDTAGAIRFAARTAGIDERFLVVNGDVVTDLDISAMVDFHQDRGAVGTIHLTPVEDPSRYGVVPTDGDGRVLDFVEKPEPGTAPSRWINAGTYVLEPEVLERIPADGPVSIERRTFPALADEGRLYGYQDDCYWVDAGTPETYLQVNLDKAGGTVVMPGASVADEATVTDSVLLPDARIEPGACVRRSIVGPGALVGPRARVDDLTVLGDGARVEEGETLVGAKRPEVEGVEGT
jgi:mannose-1-phosphate guanylyltransferase